MRKLTSILAVLFLLGSAQAVLAKPAHADAKASPHENVSTEHMSQEADINANSPAVGQEKGQARADERKAMEHPNKGKHTAKAKGKNKDTVQ